MYALHSIVEEIKNIIIINFILQNIQFKTLAVKK